MSTQFDNSDRIDLREVTDRVEELREERDADPENRTAEEWAEYYPEDAEELRELEALLSELRGYGGDHQWDGDWYPLDLIRDSNFTEAMQELVEDIGDLPRGMASYLVIDWDATAENLRHDYSSVEFAGATFWYR